MPPPSTRDFGGPHTKSQIPAQQIHILTKMSEIKLSVSPASSKAENVGKSPARDANVAFVSRAVSIALSIVCHASFNLFIESYWHSAPVRIETQNKPAMPTMTKLRTKGEILEGKGDVMRRIRILPAGEDWSEVGG